VDTEVKRFLDAAHDKARALLEQNKDLLERIAQALLDRETLDRDEIALIAAGKELPPLEPVEPESLGGPPGMAKPTLRPVREPAPLRRPLIPKEEGT
jgi:cell division protease FtsH